MRKTIEVEWLKESVNMRLDDKNLSQDEKSALCLLLEDVLHKTGSYKGFNWLAWIKGGYSRWVEAGRPEGSAKDQIVFGGPESDYQWDRVYF